MDREFMQQIAQDYYSDRKIPLSTLTETIEAFMPIYGTLEVEVQNFKNKYIIKYVDADRITVMLRPNKETGKFVEVRLTEEEIEEFSSVTKVMELTLDASGKVTLVSHGINNLFTFANKDIVLFIANLIGKTITEI